MRFIFLDFDGVLHPDNCSPSQRLCYVENFSRALAAIDPGGSIKIVLSTTWRTKYSQSELQEMLGPSIGSRVVGDTPDHFDRPGKYSRQREVEEWLEFNAPAASWLAIDDWPENFDKNCPNLFTVAGFDAADGGGITPPEVARLSDRIMSLLSA